MFDSFRDSVSVRTPDQNNALDINIMCSKKKQIINLSYMQLSEMIANVSAISNSLILLFDYFVSRLNYSIFQREVIDECLRIKIDKNPQKSSIFYYKKILSNSSNKLKSTSKFPNLNIQIKDFLKKVKPPL
jgi:hypothetical protein